jgi:hypothetical protein
MLMFPGRSQHLYDDFARVRDNLVVATRNPDVEVSETPLAKIIKWRIADNGMLDYVPLSSELSTDLQRVNVNSGGGEIPYRHTFRSLSRKAAGLMSFSGRMWVSASFIPTKGQIQKRKDGRSRLMRRGCHRFLSLSSGNQAWSYL